MSFLLQALERELDRLDPVQFSLHPNACTCHVNIHYRIPRHVTKSVQQVPHMRTCQYSGLLNVGVKMPHMQACQYGGLSVVDAYGFLRTTESAA